MNNCKHDWDGKDSLDVIHEGKNTMIWIETDYCDLCSSTRISYMMGDTDKDHNVENIRTIKESIRPQTLEEQKQAV
jgi:hypothetical protein